MRVVQLMLHAPLLRGLKLLRLFSFRFTSLLMDSTAFRLMKLYLVTETQFIVLIQVWRAKISHRTVSIYSAVVDLPPRFRLAINFLSEYLSCMMSIISS
jgi:hypothetical protein